MRADDLDQFIVHLIEGAGYWGLALLMCLENVFPPLPSEIIMGLAGIESAQGTLSLPWAIFAGSVGSLIGNLFWFALGRYYGLQRLERLVDRFGRWLTLDRGEVGRMNRFFHRHGVATIFYARMLPTVRTLISLPAGLFRMPLWKFSLWTFAGATVWNAALSGVGFELGRRVEEIDSYTGPISMAIIGIILAVYLRRVVTWRPSSGD